MTELDRNNDEDPLIKELEQDLLNLYGPLLNGQALKRILGYPTLEAMRQARRRHSIPIRIFSIEHRRGKFALAKDVAKWLVEQRNRIDFNEESNPLENKKEVKDDLA